ncbi:MAG: vWA domain-containing protein [Candidatus Brocadiia bacterium]
MNRTRGILRVLALLSLIIAAANPFLQTKAQATEGAHVVFVLDVSASMSCDDVPGYRLLAAKQWIEKAGATMQADALGCVAAGSRPVVVCPPTTDRSAFNKLMNKINPTWLSSAGTNLPAGIDEAAELLRECKIPAGFIVVASDGENFIGDVRKSIKKAKRNGMIVHTVCVGGRGARKVREKGLKGEWHVQMDRAGKPVVSRARPDRAREWAKAGGGKFWQVSSAKAQYPTNREEVITHGTTFTPSGNGPKLIAPWLCILAALSLFGDFMLPLFGKRLSQRSGAEQGRET